MATCPLCGCDLPGTETLCRDCYEKRYAEVSLPRKINWWEPGDWIVVLGGMWVIVPMILASEWFFSGRFVPLGQALLSSQKVLGVVWRITLWFLLAATVAEGIWFNLKARSAKMVFLWMMYVPVIGGFWLWKLTDSGLWLTVYMAGCSLVWLQKYYARRRGF